MNIDWPMFEDVVVKRKRSVSDILPRPRSVLRKKLVLLEPSVPDRKSPKRYLSNSERILPVVAPAPVGSKACAVCGGLHGGKNSVFCGKPCALAYRASLVFPDGTHPKHRNRYVQTSSSALHREIDWVLSFPDFMGFWGLPCHYCGDSLGDNVGLDRIDSTDGYRIGNLLPCCPPCNIMKRTMGYAEFVGRCGLIYSRLGPNKGKKVVVVDSQLTLF